VDAQIDPAFPAGGLQATQVGVELIEVEKQLR
jgi:hypothetical protein